MEIFSTGSIWTLVGVGLAIIVAIQFASEIVALAVGSLVIWALSFGRIKIGERRHLGKAPPTLNGGPVFYRVGARWYIYQNFASLLGLVVLLAALTAVFGVGMWLSAP